MKIRKLSLSLLLLVAITPAFAAVVDEGSGLTPIQVEMMKKQAKEALNASKLNESSFSDADIYNSLGITGIDAENSTQYDTSNPHNPVNLGGMQGFAFSQTGNVKLSCVANSKGSAQGLNFEVISCSGNSITANVCDQEAVGLKCDSSTSQRVTITQAESRINLKREYYLSANCTANACDINFKITAADSFANTASGGLMDSERAKNNYIANDSVFTDYLALFRPESEEAQALVQETRQEGKDFASCYQDRINELTLDGKVKTSCDPSTTDTFQFLIDNRDGDNHGKQMCARTETGTCVETATIHERTDDAGVQTCEASFTPSNNTCNVTTSIVTTNNTINYYSGGYSKRAQQTVISCGDTTIGGVPYTCKEFKFNNQVVYGNRNIPSITKADNILVSNFPKGMINKVEIYSNKYDDYIRVFAGNTLTQAGVGGAAMDARDNPNFRVAYDTHSSRWGTTRDDGSNSLANTNITTAVKNAIPNMNGNFYINASNWTVGSGDYNIRIRVTFKKYTLNLNTTSSCTGYDGRQPINGGVGGSCYQTTSNPGVCLDSASRTLHGESFNPGCWNYEKKYTCYSANATGCNTNQLVNSGWIKQGDTNKQYPSSSTGQNTSQPWKWTETWTYGASNNASTALGCAPSYTTDRTDATGGTITTTHQWCYTKTIGECRQSPPETPEEITKCHVESSRNTEITHGLVTKQEQNFKCETAYVCEGAFGNSVVDESLDSDNRAALVKIVAESEKAKALSKSLSGNLGADADGNIIVFQGKENVCYKWHSKAFDHLDNPLNAALKNLIGETIGRIDRSSRNCCQGNPDNIDVGSNFNNCTDDDIQLAGARMEGRAHLIELDNANFIEEKVDETEAGDVDLSVKTVCTYAVRSEESAGGGTPIGNECYSLGLKYQSCEGATSYCLEYATLQPDVSVGSYAANSQKVLLTWLHSPATAPGCTRAPDDMWCSDMNQANTIALNAFLSEVDNAGFYVNSTQTITFRDITNPKTVSVPASVCKTVQPATRGVITTNKSIGSIPRGQYEEEDFNNLISNEMNRNSSIYLGTPDSSGNKQYCYQHMGFSANAIVYRDGARKYIIDEENKKVYLDQLSNGNSSDPSLDEPDVAGHWLHGNRAFCSWVFDGQSRLHPPSFTPVTGGMIGTPGTVGTDRWFNDFRRIFNLPFNCQYSIIDIASTVRVDSFQTWCTFESIFSRIVQEQGRKQLALYATQPYTGASSGSANFTFYKGNGEWTAQKIVNGNDVRFWQWPNGCVPSEDNSAFIGHAMATGSGCPQNADVLVAICAKQGTCGVLPSNPTLESSKWDVRVLHAENTEIQALTPLVVAKGGCSSAGACSYTINAWKHGVGGSVDIPLDLNWSLQSAASGWDINYTAHNNIHFKALTYPLNDSSTTPKIKMCIGSATDCSPIGTSGGGTWRDITLNNPTAMNGQVINTGSPKVTAIGQCNAQTNKCAYRITINIKLNAKPWHTGITYDTYSYRLRPKVLGKPIGPKHRTKYNYKVKSDCSGFTLDEFLALDIAAMDFSEFATRVAAEAEAKITEMMTDGLVNIEDNVAKLKTGVSISTTGTGSSNFRLAPNNGYPGEETTFTPVYSASGNKILQNNGKEVELVTVTGVVIDWGDGSAKTTITANQTATHTYGNRSRVPSTSEVIEGVIEWQTTAGVVKEGFTYKLWVEGDSTGRATEGGGNSFSVGSGNSVYGTSETDLRKLQNSGSDVKAYDVNNW